MNQDFQQIIDDLQARVSGLEQGNKMPPVHTHNGFDSTKVLWGNIDQRILLIHHTIVGTAAATATNYGVFYIVPSACVVVSFKEVHQTAGSDGSAVTLDLEKLTGTQAPDAGVSALSTALSLKATANTVQAATITATHTSRTLAMGDRLCMKDTGTLTAVANVTVLLGLQLI